MTRLAISQRAADDIERLTGVLLAHLPVEAARTADLIFKAFKILVEHPEVGRPAGVGLRELVISRGRTGYLALYAFDEEADLVLVLAVRRQREAGYA